MRLKELLAPFEPWITVIGLLCGLWGVYATFRPNEASSVSYSLKSIAIVQPSNLATSLTVTDKDGRKLTDNIFALSVTVWNSGDFTLGKQSDKVRVPLNIRVGGSAKVVDSFVQRATLDKALLRVVQSSANSVQIQWDQFDPGDAFILTLLYEASEQEEAVVEGKFVNTSLVNRTDIENLRMKDHPWRNLILTFSTFNRIGTSFVVMFSGFLLILQQTIVLIFRAFTRSYWSMPEVRMRVPSPTVYRLGMTLVLLGMMIFIISFLFSAPHVPIS